MYFIIQKPLSFTLLLFFIVVKKNHKICLFFGPRKAYALLRKLNYHIIVYILVSREMRLKSNVSFRVSYFVYARVRALKESVVVICKVVSQQPPSHRLGFWNPIEPIATGRTYRRQPFAGPGEADETRRRREYEMNAFRREPVTHTSRNRLIRACLAGIHRTFMQGRRYVFKTDYSISAQFTGKSI